VFALPSLGAENDVARVKKCDGIEKFEKYCFS